MKFLHDITSASPALKRALLGAVMLLSGCGAGGGGNAPADAIRPVAQSLANAQVVAHADVGYAVWIQEADKSGRSGLFASRQRNGVWDLPQQIHALAKSHSEASEPRWVVHPDGEATLVWLQSSQGGVRQVFHSHTVKGVWRAGAPIGPMGGDVEARRVQIGADGVGNAMAVWSEAAVGDPVARSVWASRFDGRGFGSPEKLSEGDWPADAPRITLDAQSALVVWSQDEGHRSNLSASVYWNGVWTPSKLVDSDTSSDPLWAQVLPRIF